MGLAGYIARRIVLYTVVFFTALSITWLIPRLLGNPVAIVVARLGYDPTNPTSSIAAASYFMQAFGFDKPLYEQYFIFLRGLFSGDLGVSLWLLGRPVSSIVYKALIFDIILMAPAIIISWFIGNYLGALAARHKRLDRVLMPVFYVLTATPYFVLAILLQWTLTARYKVFPTIISATIFDQLLRSPTWESISSFLHAITLPMLSLIVVSIGNWASGMRTLMIYELESNYSRFMEMLGVSEKKISLYAFRYAINPQISGLGIQLGTLIVGATGVEFIFNYPGLGFILSNAIISNDPFLLEGAVLLLVLMVIAANFIVDILYAILDPRIRIGVVS